MLSTVDENEKVLGDYNVVIKNTKGGLRENTEMGSVYMKYCYKILVYMIPQNNHYSLLKMLLNGLIMTKANLHDWLVQ